MAKELTVGDIKKLAKDADKVVDRIAPRRKASKKSVRERADFQTRTILSMSHPLGKAVKNSMGVTLSELLKSEDSSVSITSADVIGHYENLRKYVSLIR